MTPFTLLKRGITVKDLAAGAMRAKMLPSITTTIIIHPMVTATLFTVTATAIRIMVIGITATEVMATEVMATEVTATEVMATEVMATEVMVTEVMVTAIRIMADMVVIMALVLAWDSVLVDLVLDTVITIPHITSVDTDMATILAYRGIPDAEEVLQTIQTIELHPNSTILHQTGEVR